MELKDRKRVYNTHKLPGFVNGISPVGAWSNITPQNAATYGGNPPINPVVTTTNASSGPSKFGQTMKTIGNNALENAGNLITEGIGMYGAVKDASTYDNDAQGLSGEAGTSERNIGGVGFTQYNDPNSTAEMKRVNAQATGNTLGSAGAGAALGGTIGSIIPGVGTAIGTAAGAIIGGVAGWIGAGKKKEKARRALEEARIRNQALTSMNRDDALTKSIRLANAREIGNPAGQMYAFAGGKQPVYGFVDGKANARVSNGELIGNFEDGTVERVGRGKDNKDSRLARLRPSDFVITNKYGLSDYAAATGDFEGALNMQAQMNKYKNGKLPGFKDGNWENIIPSALGTAIGLGQYLDAKGQSVYRPNTYAANPYETEGLSTLAELRTNPYPTLNQLREAEARQNAAINQSGGLSAGQRWLSRAATLNATQQNMGKYLSDVQAQNNAYRQAYANAALSTGQANAQRRQQAYQWDADTYAKGHAARQDMMQMGLRNMLDQIQSYYANSWKKNQFDKMYGLYSQQQQIEMDKYLRSLGTGSSDTWSEFDKYPTLMETTDGRNAFNTRAAQYLNEHFKSQNQNDTIYMDGYKLPSIKDALPSWMLDPKNFTESGAAKMRKELRKKK